MFKDTNFAPLRTLNLAAGPVRLSPSADLAEIRGEQEPMTCVRGCSISRVVIVVRMVK